MNSGRFLDRPVDNSQLIAFRILFGLLLALEGMGRLRSSGDNRVL